MTDMSRIRWGILGAARINRRVVPAIQASPNGITMAIASRSATRGEEAARRYGISRVHGSYEAVLADDEIDAVRLMEALIYHFTRSSSVAGF